jgi:hypothetical protein
MSAALRKGRRSNMVFVETEVNSDRAPVVKILLAIDDYNQLMVEKNPYDFNAYKIFNYDSLTKTVSQLADFVNGKYIIYNEPLFNQYYLKPLKQDKKLVKDLQNFIKGDHNMDGFKKFTIKFICFKRRVNINVTKLIRKTKRAIWE